MKTIYISLLNEGVSTWRPVEVLELEENIYLIPAETEVCESEEWEFKPGEKVKCKNHTFSNGEMRLIAFAYA